MNNKQSCSCSIEKPAVSPVGVNRFIYLIPLTLLWIIIYFNLQLMADWLTTLIYPSAAHPQLKSALAFFLFETPKVLMLLTAVVFGIGIIRSFFTPENTRKLLAGRKEFTGNILAALLGIVTPFCSCSAVPLFIGFMEAGVPMGVAFSFLISAPVINEIAVVLLWGLVGWKITLFYIAIGLFIAITSGWIIGRLKMEKYVEDWVWELQGDGTETEKQKLSWPERVTYAQSAVKEIVGKVWLYVLAGIAIGAFIHGYVPEGMLAHIMGADTWWSVPAAVGIGIPMYSNAAGIIPVIKALMEKGAAVGTALAFMMSVIALSLPEFIILRKVLKIRLIATLILIIGISIALIGWIINALNLNL
jgi:uncharacterized membrane protein YraQ (UPF0718 family)